MPTEYMRDHASDISHNPELIPNDILRSYGFKEGEELAMQSKEREKKIEFLRSSLENLKMMATADSQAPEHPIERKSTDEQLNMAQDNFVLGLRSQLSILSNSKLNLIEDPAELRRILFYYKLIEAMLEKKDKIVKEGAEQKLSKENTFRNKRKQRIDDIETLKMMIPVVGEIIKNAALQLGVNLDGEETQYLTKP